MRRDKHEELRFRRDDEKRTVKMNCSLFYRFYKRDWLLGGLTKQGWSTFLVFHFKKNFNSLWRNRLIFQPHCQTDEAGSQRSTVITTGVHCWSPLQRSAGAESRGWDRAGNPPAKHKKNMRLQGCHCKSMFTNNILKMSWFAKYIDSSNQKQLFYSFMKECGGSSELSNQQVPFHFHRNSKVGSDWA